MEIWKKINILTLVLSEKKILNETKNHNPSFKLNGRSLIKVVIELERSVIKHRYPPRINISLISMCHTGIPLVNRHMYNRCILSMHSIYSEATLCYQNVVKCKYSPRINISLILTCHTGLPCVNKYAYNRCILSRRFFFVIRDYLM